MIRAMLVDDEEWCLDELGDILRAAGNTVVTGAYTSAAEALEVAARDGPDIVFIDVQLPGMTGLELAQRLKVASMFVRVAV